MSANSRRLLHFADLHYADSKNNYRDDNKISLPDAVRESEIEAFHGVLDRVNNGADAVFVTGDITTQGRATGFKQFRNATLPKLLTKLREDDGLFAVVPGNHDVRWRVPPTSPDFFQQKFEEYRKQVTAIRRQCETRRTLFATGLIPQGNPEIDSNSLDFRQDLPAVSVNHDGSMIVVCINSAVRCGEYDWHLYSALLQPLKSIQQQLDDLILKSNSPTDNTQSSQLPTDLKRVHDQVSELISKSENSLAVTDPSHVTQSQIVILESALNKVRRQMSAGQWQNAFRVALIHHPLCPFPFALTELKPFVAMLDASRVLDFLHRNHIQVVLSGHKHQAYLHPSRMTDGSELVIVGGPTVAGYPPAGSPRGFQEIQLTRRGRQLGVGVKNWRNDGQDSEYTEYEFIDSEDAKYSRHFCSRSAQAILPETWTEPEDAEGRDSTNEFMIFANVQSCQETRRNIVPILRELECDGHLLYWGVYDLYGQYDILIRGEVAQKSDWNILTGRLRPLLPEEKYELDLLSAHSMDGPYQRLPLRSQDYYDQSRSFKAFIVVEGLAGDVLHRELAPEVRAAFGAWPEGDIRNCRMYVGPREVIVEFFARCGDYSTLYSITRQVEKVADRKHRDKHTHLAYFHHESSRASDRPALTSLELGGKATAQV